MNRIKRKRKKKVFAIVYCNIRQKNDSAKTEKELIISRKCNSEFRRTLRCGTRQFVMRPMGALTFYRAVRGDVAAAALFHFIVQFSAVAARSGGFDGVLIVIFAIQVKRYDESRKPGTIPASRQVLLLLRSGLDLDEIQPQDVAKKLKVLGVQEEGRDTFSTCHRHTKFA